MDPRKNYAQVLRDDDASRQSTQSPQLSSWQGNYEELKSLHVLYVRTVNEQLYFRFPFINDLNALSSDEIRSVCDFALTVTPIVQEAWLESIERLGKIYMERRRETLNRR